MTIKKNNKKIFSLDKTTKNFAKILNNRKTVYPNITKYFFLLQKRQI